jgi:hypothetical protein
VASDLNSDRSTSDLLFDPFRLLGVGPWITDSGIDSAYDLARQKQAAAQHLLSDALSAIKDQTRRLQAELVYPLDGRSDDLDSFYSDTLSTIDEVVEVALRFPALTRTNFLVRSAVRLGVSNKLTLALVDGHAAIDPMEIYQLLQRLRHQAGRPAPSLMDVRKGLDELLAAHCRALTARIDSTEALIHLVLSVKESIQFSRERARLEVFATFLNACRAPLNQALVQSQSKIKGACDRLRNRLDDIREIAELAEKYRAWASLYAALEFAGQLPIESKKIVWEQLGELLQFLVERHHFEPAQRTLDAIIEAVAPSANLHAQLVALAQPFQQQIDWYRTTEPDRTENSRDEHAAERWPRRYGLIVALLLVGVVILLVSSVVVWRFQEAPSIDAVQREGTLKAEPESLPPASRGHRYSRELVRYCLFQEERLRVVKRHLQGQEDIRAYNALASDWNSRCADYFYQDEDLRVVKAEAVARQKQLEADALRILSTWPWRTTGGAVPAK